MAFFKVTKKQEGGSATVTSGSFTTGSTADYVSEINCGFQPDYVEVEMEFSTGHTLACAFLEQRDDQTTPIGRSVWDLRPLENVCYDLTLGSSNGETGICDITSTGFKYRAHGNNTLNKACTYKAFKFQ